MKAVLRPLMTAVLALAATTSQAGLFEDDDARRAILELRQQRTQDQEALTARLTALSTQIDTLRRSLLDMNAQIEQLKGDLANQRGQNELLARDLAEVQRRQKDLQQGVDERIRKFEPQPVTLDGKTFNVDPDEKKAFEDALARMRQADFAGGAKDLQVFLAKYPRTGYRESTLYWLGNAYYGLRDHKEAIAQFKALLGLAPQHMRAPEALLSVANCQSELKDAKAARKTLEELVKSYPEAEAAQVARERLAASPAPTASGKAR